MTRTWTRDNRQSTDARIVAAPATKLRRTLSAVTQPAAIDTLDPGTDRWIAPPALTGVLARLFAALRPAQRNKSGFDQAFGAALAAGAVLATDSRHLVTVAAALGERVTVALPATPIHDGLARAIKAVSAGVVRPEAGQVGATSKPPSGSVLLMPISDAPRIGWTAGDVAALAGKLDCPAMVLVVNADRTYSLEQGLPVCMELAFGRAEAAVTTPFPPTHGPVGLALIAEAIGLGLATAAPPISNRVATRRHRRPVLLNLYRIGMSIFSTFALPYLFARRQRGKEVGGRLAERRGRSTQPRPKGRLIWMHGASVGESVSILPLINVLLDRNLIDTVLVTTGTVTSAKIMDQRLPDRAIHQFIPLDAPAFARRFIDHWHPDAAVFVESELWPNLMIEAARRGVPLALVNGRMSTTSFERWSRLPQTARAMMATVRLVLAQSPADATRFSLLGASHVRHEGNLKFDCPAPPFDPSKKGDLDEATRIRPVWLAASTHEGEEMAIVEAHIATREHFPNLLTIVVPRHPERGEQIARLFEQRSLTAARRSTGAAISQEVEIYLADTIGELGLFYRLAEIAFVGGSLVAAGGHNPIEPAQLGCAILHGPDVRNFADMYESFDAGGGAISVSSPNDLAKALTALLADMARIEVMAAANQTVIERSAGSLSRTAAALTPFLRH